MIAYDTYKSDEDRIVRFWCDFLIIFAMGLLYASPSTVHCCDLRVAVAEYFPSPCTSSSWQCILEFGLVFQRTGCTPWWRSRRLVTPAFATRMARTRPSRMRCTLPARVQPYPWQRRWRHASLGRRGVATWRQEQSKGLVEDCARTYTVQP